MADLKKLIKGAVNKDPNKRIYKTYYDRYEKYSFQTANCKSVQQYEASITRYYHTIEKGLSYIDYRAGFGKSNINALLTEMQNYVTQGYSTETAFYRTGLCVLHLYIDKNKKYGFVDEKLNDTVSKLPGIPNDEGGIFEFEPPESGFLQRANYEEFLRSRHSIRHFSDIPVDMEKVKHAVELAQLTPSACNRQGWRVRVIEDEGVLESVLKNQNGNRGFGQEIDKLMLVTSDLRYFNNDREMFQAYIDGGMYAMSLINGLHFEGIGTIPLSGSLTEEQDANVRNILKLDEPEIIILFVGIGNYPDKCQTTMSIRHEPRMEII